MNQLLTHSRQQSFKLCRRQDWFANEQRIRTTVDAKALRMGSAFHAGQEALATTGSIESACEIVRSHYSVCPDSFEPYWWDIERETIERLLCGYQWRWANAPIETLEAERSFLLPLINPDTNAKSTIWKIAGKIDGIVRLEDRRLAVREFKLLGEDISPAADLWRRMQIDHQITGYVHAARQLGFDVATVLYDVTRKPVIEPSPVPIIDDLGVNIVLDANGERVKTQKGTWRTTSDKERGYVLQTRPMTVQEWGEKLTDDIVKRPEFYFNRTEIARLDCDILDYQYERWEVAQTIREAQRNNRWFRTVSKNTCNFCAWFTLCTNSFDPENLPEGFIRVENIHPELAEAVCV